MVFCTTKTVSTIGGGRAVHFFCVQNVNKRWIYLSLFEPGHFSCQFNSKRVRLYLAKWASCDNCARWSFQKRRSHCLVTFSPPSPSWYLTNSRIYRRGRLPPPLHSVLLFSIFFQNQRWRTQTFKNNWVFVRTKNTPQEMENTLQTGKNWKSFRTKRVSLIFGGWEVVWVIHPLFLKKIKRTRSKSFVTPENIRFLW